MLDLEAALRKLVDDAVAPLVAEVRQLRRAIEQRETANPWVTRQELAQQLGVHTDTVDARSGSGGDVERMRIGRAVRVRLRPRATDDEVARAAARAIG
jgi:hypothetical protein